MKNIFLFLISLISILIIVESCNTTSKIYPYYDNNKTSKGQLSDSIFTALNKYLKITEDSKLRDTIIIKYDYNNESCWDILDESDDRHIMDFVSRHQERVQKALLTRKNVLIFEFREPGNNLNKIKKFNNLIIIDKSKQLFNLLFKERSPCGNSIIIMPDKKFVFLRSDSHSRILDLTKQQVEEILAKNNISHRK